MARSLIADGCTVADLPNVAALRLAANAISEYVSADVSNPLAICGLSLPPAYRTLPRYLS